MSSNYFTPFLKIHPEETHRFLAAIVNTSNSTNDTESQQQQMGPENSTGVLSAVGTVIAVTTLTLFLSTGYMVWRVYFK